MAWKVEFTEDAEKELDALDPQAARRILNFLQRISGTNNPRRSGGALKGSRYKSLWRYRVGSYRIIVSIEDATSTVFVLRIAHRREAYR